jgi:hypothetical protein
MPLHRIELAGLDAGNLLGYLAALGTLRILTVADPSREVRLGWTESPGWWMPVVFHSETRTEDELVAELIQACGEEVNPSWSLAEDLTIPISKYAGKAEDFRRAAPTSLRDRIACEFMAAFGSDGRRSSGKEDLIADTEFRTMSGAGHQHFLGFMRDLHMATTADHLKAALLEEWIYGDDKPSMRWDPNDHRPHALRAEDPSTDPIRTVRGANRLAIEALPLFPTMPSERGLRTTGFGVFDGEVAITYPVWTEPLQCDTVRSLLAVSELQTDRPQRKVLAARGIAQAWRARRFTEGKYRNFSPSHALV